MATIPHPRQIQVAVVDWLDRRFPFTETVDEALYQRVPNYANAFYYCFGGMVFMLLVFLLLALTGYLLPWDTKAYWATSVTIQIAAGSPIIGGLLQAVLLGGPTLGPSTLQRFFAIHVFLLPGLLILLMYVHFRIIRRLGISEPL